MHHARIDKSERLQRVLALLRDGAWHTTRNIVFGAEVMAVNSVVAELRANGYIIECESVSGIRGRYRYRLVEQMELAL
jgi:hypothetical protein